MGTSLLVQMARALAQQRVPSARQKAWRRSWMLGYCTAVVSRVREAEDAAAAAADSDSGDGPVDGKSTALVLADRSLVIRRQVQQAYPRTRKSRVTYTGTGYRDGYAEGQKADIGSTKVGSRAAKPLSS